MKITLANFCSLIIFLVKFVLPVSCSNKLQDASADFTNEIFIGGLFRGVNYDCAHDSYCTASPIRTANLQLAAFVMAVDEINNKTDGIFDDILPNTKLNIAVDWNQRAIPTDIPNYVFEGAFDAYLLGENSETVLGVVDGLPDGSVESSVLLLNDWSIPTMIVQSSLPDLSHGSIYPLNTRLVPSDSLSSAMVYYVLKKYKWNRIALVYSTDTLGQDAYVLFKYFSSIDNSVKVLTTQSFPSTQTDMTDVIENIVESGATIIVLLMNDLLTGRFLVQAHAEGILSSKVQIIGISLTTSIDSVINAGATKYSIVDTMTGYLAVAPAPQLFYQMSLGKEFLSRFRNLPPTMSEDADGTTFCNDRTDDSSTSLNKLYAFGFDTGSICFGITSFSDLAEDGSDLDTTVMYTYTAVYVFAIVADVLIKSGVESVTSDMMYALLTSNFSISGVSRISEVGNVTFSQGIPGKDYFMKGDRLSGHIYELLNFNENHYMESGEISSSALVSVGIIDDNNGLLLCDELESHGYDVDCYDTIFRQGSNPPSDVKSESTNYLSDSTSNAFIAFGCIQIFLSFIQLGLVVVYRSTKVIINAQIKVLFVLIFSGFLGGIRIIFEGVNPSNIICGMQIWLEHISFRLLYSSLMLKLWRIDKIINTIGIKRVKITENDVILYVVAHVIAIMVGLAIVSGTGYGGMATKVTEYRNEFIYEDYCTKTISDDIGGILLFTIYLSEACYIILSLYYLYRTRSVPASVNEVSVLGPSMIFSVLIIVVILVIIFAMNLDQIQVNVAITAGFVCVNIPGGSFYFFSKYQLIREELSKGQAVELANKSFVASLTHYVSKFHSTLFGDKNDDDSIYQIARAELKTVKGADRHEFIDMSIEIWNKLFIDLVEEENSKITRRLGSVVPEAVDMNCPNPSEA